MRTITALTLAFMSSTAFAAPTAQTVRGETIEIHGRAPVAVPPTPAKNYHSIAPRYSDYAIEHNTWTRAWVLLEIDEQGGVARMKMLKHPGAELELYAVDYAFGMKFQPARDGGGNPTRTLYVTAIEWPAYWWMVERTGVATGIPNADHVPCRGSGPLHLGSMYSTVYRDCTDPDLSRMNAEPWITHSH
jgi:hypothetical protein